VNVLSGAQTPLLALFWVARRIPRWIRPRLTEAFDAVQKVVPARHTVQYVGHQQEYMSSLAAASDRYHQRGRCAGTTRPNRAAPVRSSADTAGNVVKKMAIPSRSIRRPTSKPHHSQLLQGPIDYADALTKGMGGRDQCPGAPVLRCVRPRRRQIPFNSCLGRSGICRNWTAIFRPARRQIVDLSMPRLCRTSCKSRAPNSPNPTGGVQLNRLLDFFKHAARFSDALNRRRHGAHLHTR